MPDGPSPPPAPFDGPEERLLLDAGRGDRGALEALYERFARPLMAFLHALTADAGQAEDLLQETFLKAWRAAPRWEPRAKASTWLFEIARRTAWNAAAKRRPQRLSEQSAAATPARAPVPDADPALAARLARAVALLTPPLRLAFVLVRVSGLSLAEAAAVAGVPVGTIKSRLAAAEASLRLALADLGPAERGPAERGPAARGPAARGPAARGPDARGAR